MHFLVGNARYEIPHEIRSAASTRAQTFSGLALSSIHPAADSSSLFFSEFRGIKMAKSSGSPIGGLASRKEREREKSRARRGQSESWRDKEIEEKSEIEMERSE